MCKYKKELKKLYEKKGFHDEFREEYKYLKDAILRIDTLWNKNLKKVKEINLIIFGEAPLWGEDDDKQSYICNPEFTGNTSFFYYSNFKNKYGTSINSRIELIRKCNQKGIIFLDVFPFPFSSTTSINYRKLNPKDYTELLEDTFNKHLKPKLKRILKKTNQNFSPKYAYRYAATAKSHHSLLTLCRNVNYSLPINIVCISNGRVIHQGKLSALMP